MGIEIVNVSKKFGEQVVLDDMSLSIPAGKITVIIGRSGEGKSVLFKHMIGLLKPDSGQILVDDVDLLTLDDFALNEMRKKFGMLFQSSALFDSMTIAENIAFPLVEHSDFGTKQITERVHELIEMVGLKENVLAKYPSELSGGMRKRVGLARAIALKPQILLYDEPTTGLDPIMTDVVDHLILNTQRKLNLTSVVISHNIQGVFTIADNIAMLHEGKIILEGDPKVFQGSKNPFVCNFLEGKSTHHKDKET